MITNHNFETSQIALLAQGYFFDRMRHLSHAASEHLGIWASGQTGRQTGRQAGRQAGRKAGRKAGRQAEKTGSVKRAA